MKDIRKYWIAIFAIMFSVVFISAIIAFISGEKYFVSRNKNELKKLEEMNTIINSLQLPVHISRTMSHNEFLRDWLKNGEKNSETIYNYLGNMKKNWGFSAFVASAETHNYYFSDSTHININKDTPDGGWFFELLENKITFLSDVGYHYGDINKPFVYTDVAMLDESGDILAFVGTAVELNKIMDDLETYQLNHKEAVHFVNQTGICILSSSKKYINTVADKHAWYKLYNDNEDHENLNEKTKFGLNRVTINRNKLKSLGWTMYIEHDLNPHYHELMILYTWLVSIYIILLIISGVILMFMIKRFKNDLQSAFSKIKRLQGIIPICSVCKKIRDDNGYWKQLERYIRDHSDADLSHGICPDCAKRLYPDIDLEDEDM